LCAFRQGWPRKLSELNLRITASTVKVIRKTKTKTKTKKRFLASAETSFISRSAAPVRARRLLGERGA
jgi:hypothetical protein